VPRAWSVAVVWFFHWIFPRSGDSDEDMMSIFNDARKGIFLIGWSFSGQKHASADTG
jgi:hypothetical protein